MKQKKPLPAWKIAEREVTKDFKAFMADQGWRLVRNQVSKVATPYGAFQTGEDGMPDFTAVFYLDVGSGATVTLWCELKAPGKSLRPSQIEWHAKERAKGGRVVVIDDVPLFAGWYAKHFGWLSDYKVQGDLALEPVEERAS